MEIGIIIIRMSEIIVVLMPNLEFCCTDNVV